MYDHDGTIIRNSFFKKKKYLFVSFLNAISEGIKDTFKEMGYSLNGVNKKGTNVEDDLRSSNDQSKKPKLNAVLYK